MADRLLTRRDELRNWWARVSMRLVLRGPQPADQQMPPMRREGKYLTFCLIGNSFTRPCWEIRSRRGNFPMGVIEWSPQWEAYSFVSAGEPNDVVRWNAGSIAEVYAFLRERGTATGRFV